MANNVATRMAGNAGHQASIPFGTFMPKKPEIAAGIMRMIVMVVNLFMIALRLLLIMLE